MVALDRAGVFSMVLEGIPREVAAQYGLTPGARVPAVLGNRVSFVDGVPAGPAGARGTRAEAG